jgi:hypothetical protein
VKMNVINSSEQTWDLQNNAVDGVFGHTITIAVT